MKIQLKKVSEADNPKVPTPSNKDFVPGEDNGNVSVPIEYTITGILQEDVEVGKPMIILRHTRNGVESFGIMVTSVVTDIVNLDENGMMIYTNNSVYDLEWIEDDG